MGGKISTYIVSHQSLDFYSDTWYKTKDESMMKCNIRLLTLILTTNPKPTNLTGAYPSTAECTSITSQYKLKFWMSVIESKRFYNAVKCTFSIYFRCLFTRYCSVYLLSYTKTNLKAKSLIIEMFVYLIWWFCICVINYKTFL